MKNILSSVRGWVVVGVVLGSGGAWGQGEIEVDVDSTTGCKAKYYSYYARGLREKIKWKGDCVNGYQEGVGAQLLHFPNAVILEHGKWIQGRRAGVSVTLYSNNRSKYGLSEHERYGDRVIYTPINFPIMNLNQLKKDVDVSISRNLARADGAVGLSGDKIIEIITDWTAMENGGMPELAFEKYTVNAGAGSSSATSPNANGKDDPKVFGRGARGR